MRSGDLGGRAAMDCGRRRGANCVNGVGGLVDDASERNDRDDAIDESMRSFTVSHFFFIFSADVVSLSMSSTSPFSGIMPCPDCPNLSPEPKQESEGHGIKKKGGVSLSDWKKKIKGKKHKKAR